MLILGLGLVVQFSFSQQETPPEVRNIYSVMDKIGYPEAAKSSRIEGKVLTEVTVDEKGKVSDHQILESPSPLLSEAVSQHIHALRFDPATKNGQPIVSKVRVPFMFQLSEEADPQEGKLFESVAGALAYPDQVVELDLSGQSADKLDPGLAACRNIRILILDDMKLDKVPSFVKSLKSVEELSLVSNQLTSLPGWLGKLPALKSLDLRDNAFSEAALDKIRSQYSSLELLTD